MTQDEIDDALVELDLAREFDEYYVFKVWDRDTDVMTTTIWLACYGWGMAATAALVHTGDNGYIYGSWDYHIPSTLDDDRSWGECGWIGGLGRCDGSSISGVEWDLIEGREAEVWSLLHDVIRHHATEVKAA